MKKEVKIILYCLLAVVIILVFCLMIWWHKQNAWEPDISPEDTYEEVEAEENITKPQPTQNSEQDILNDLESLFHSNDGYENVGWEYGFINVES